MDQAQIVKEIEKARVREAIVRQLDGGDYPDYRMMRDQLADEVTIDFGGVQPRLTQTAEALVQYAQNVHGKLNVVQHHVMNQQVEISGDEATCLSKGIAYNEHPVSQGEGYWLLYCRYEHGLRKIDGKWKITRIKMTPLHSDGNSNLLQQFEKDRKSK